MLDINTLFYDGDGVSGLYIWGAQLTDYTFNTTYIKTEASAFNNTINIPRNESNPTKDVLGYYLQYAGKVGGRASFTDSNCWTYVATSYYNISGLLTTDTIEVFGNSDIPTIPTNGQLHIASGEKAYGITIKRSGAVWDVFNFTEKIYTPGTHQVWGTVNGNIAVLTNGSTSSEGKQDEYHPSQLGILDDGTKQVSIKQDLSAFADGTPLSDPDAILQDGFSFLDTGTKLEHYKYPALVISEQNNRFFTDANDDIVRKSFADFTGTETGDRIYDDISETDKVKNIRVHKAALNARQANTEKIITNN
jgi:hypothetical protein